MLFAVYVPYREHKEAKPNQAKRVWHSGLCRAGEARFLDAVAPKSISPRVIFRAIVAEITSRKLMLSNDILLLPQESRKFTFHVCFFSFLLIMK